MRRDGDTDVLSLWAATGQAALESSRILVIGASATATSILQNLVLPGIGHFTILDHRDVTPADAGNNFFLEGPASIGKKRAEEAVRLLLELNDGVSGAADTRDIAQLLQEEAGRAWIKGFSLVIAHNLTEKTLSDLSTLLWEDIEAPPFVVVKSAGFIAEFYFQYHEHQSTPHATA
jgi:NEDD8-activating enzyme E1 regulatory subunit